MCRSDDVDDSFGVGGVFRRGVGDGLDAVEGVGRQGFEICFEVLLGEFRGFVVYPNLHTRHTAKGYVAFHVHLHAGGVLQGVVGGSGLYRRIVGNVVDKFFAVLSVKRPLSLYSNGFKHRALFHVYVAEGSVVLHLERDITCCVSYICGTQKILTRRHFGNLEITIEVGGGAAYKAAVLFVEHSHIAESQRLVFSTVDKGSHHFEGGAAAHFFLFHGLSFFLSIAHIAVETLAAGETATRALAAGSSSRTTARKSAARLGHKGNANY